MSTLSDNILIRIGYCNDSAMHGSGIPPHLAMAAGLAEVTAELKRLKKRHRRDTNRLPDIISAKVVKTIMKKLKIKGAVPLTQDDLTAQIAGLQTSIMSCRRLNLVLKESVSGQFLVFQWRL